MSGPILHFSSAPRRLPFGPLEHFLRLEWAGPSSYQQNGWCAQEMATRLHVNVGSIHRWRKLGVPYWRADEFAALLNTHIALIWPDHALDVPLEDDMELV